MFLGKERRNTASELRRSEQKFRHLLEDAVGYLCILNGQGYLQYTSPPLQRDLSILPDQWKQNFLSHYIHPEDRSIYEAAFLQWSVSSETCPAIELRMQATNGSLLDVEVTANNLLHDPDIQGIVIQARSITKDRAVEEKLRILESAISEAHDAVLVANSGFSESSEPIIEYANSAMQTLLEDHDSPLVGKPVGYLIDKLSPQNRDLAVKIAGSLTAGKSAQAVFESHTAAGRVRWLDVRCEPIMDQFGKLRHWVSVVRDVTTPRLAILLEKDRNRILELIGRNAPVAEILTLVAHKLERQIPHAYVAIFRVQGDMFSCEAAHSFPIEYQHQLLTQPTVFALTQIHHTKKDVQPSMKSMNLFLKVPILAANESVLGMLAIYHFEGTTLDQHPDWIKSAVNLAAIALEHRQMTETLAYQAKYDSLTGLPNRNQLEALMPQFIEQAKAADDSIALGFLDLDRFKQINDSLGHFVGDLLLKQIGMRLRHALCPNDFLVRFGGDEFVVVMKDCNPPEEVKDRARRFLNAFQSPFQVEGYELHLTASMGVSVHPQDGVDMDSLLRNADHAMYRAKNLGKNELVIYTPTSGSTPVQRLEMEFHLRRAIENRELRLNYHPVLHLNGKLHGFEVLLSWQHPNLGRIAPMEFIPIAEESALILPIGTWVLEQACLQAAAWQRSGYDPVRVCVNVSPLQFDRPGFVDIVASALAISSLDPRYLTLEITESLIMRNMQEASAKMLLLRAIGVGIAIDDFGTGYSSLNYLRQLPADQLKIDQSFLKEMTSETSTSYSVIQTITSLAHSLRLKVIVEGVERQEQLDMLSKAGCDLVQGHLFAEPIPAVEAEKWLNKGFKTATA